MGPLGHYIDAGPFRTNVLEHGTGPAVVLLHGSGPGVSAHENWSGVIGNLGVGRRVIAPDIVGFGYTEYGAEHELDIKIWSKHILDLLDALGIEKAVLVGNSFGGALSLALTLRHPDRVAGLVLMGTPAGEFEQSAALAHAGEFDPSPEAMRRLLLNFPYDAAMVTDAMVETRHATSLRHKDTPFFKKLMNSGNRVEADGRRIVKGVPLAALAVIEQPTLILHGREDQVIPADVAVSVHKAIPNSHLVLFGKTGHWVQIERAEAFAGLVRGFLDTMEWGGDA